MKSVQLPTDRAIGRVRGLDFVEMDIKAEGLAVIETLNRAEETSCELKVNKAEPLIAGVRLVVVGKTTTRVPLETTGAEVEL